MFIVKNLRWQLFWCRFCCTIAYLMVVTVGSSHLKLNKTLFTEVGHLLYFFSRGLREKVEGEHVHSWSHVLSILNYI